MWSSSATTKLSHSRSGPRSTWPWILSTIVRSSSDSAGVRIRQVDHRRRAVVREVQELAAVAARVRCKTTTSVSAPASSSARSRAVSKFVVTIELPRLVLRLQQAGDPGEQRDGRRPARAPGRRGRGVRRTAAPLHASATRTRRRRRARGRARPGSRSARPGAPRPRLAAGDGPRFTSGPSTGTRRPPSNALTTSVSWSSGEASAAVGARAPLLSQDRRVDLLERGPGLDPELVDERAAGCVVGTGARPPGGLRGRARASAGRAAAPATGTGRRATRARRRARRRRPARGRRRSVPRARRGEVPRAGGSRSGRTSRRRGRREAVRRQSASASRRSRARSAAPAWRRLRAEPLEARQVEAVAARRAARSRAAWSRPRPAPRSLRSCETKF